MNGDFEVMPIGTIAEIENLRKLSSDLIKLATANASKEMLIDKIMEIESFYKWHTLTYSVKV